jgi:hypothetical protein
MSMKILLTHTPLVPNPEASGEDASTHINIGPQVLLAMESHDASEEFKAHLALEMFRLMEIEAGNYKPDHNNVIAAEFIIRIEYP